MERFEHRMRTTQHTKSVQMIMTRTNFHFFNSKSPRKRPAPQGDNITTYLRKFQIERQNLNLAKRIMQCQSQHSKQRYAKQWENVQRFLKVRSNFKKTLHAKEPKIFKFEPISGRGKLKVDFEINDIQIQNGCFSKKNLYRLSFILGNKQIQPEKNLITIDLIKGLKTCFYAPLFLKKKKISSKIYQIQQNNYYEFGKYQIDLGCKQNQQVEIFNKAGKIIGKVNFNVKVFGGRKKHRKLTTQNKENQLQAIQNIKQTDRQIRKNQSNDF